MEEFIRYVCENYGPRLSGSYGEERAGEYIYTKMGEFADSVEKEYYVSRPRGFLDFIWFTAAFYVTGAVFYFLGYVFIASSFIFLSLLIYVLQQNLLMEVVDVFFPPVKEFHVIGKLKPRKETKNLVILSAHYDSAYEFPLLGRWRKKGVAFINITVAFSVASLFGAILSYPFDFLRFPEYFLLVVSSILVLYLSLTLRSGRAVPGANDDLAAVAVIMEAGKEISSRRPEKTEVWILAIAGEEHMRGSKRFVENHLKELKERNALVFNLETPSGDYFLIATEEKMFVARHSEEAVRILEDSAKRAGARYTVGSLPFMGSDAANFSRKGIRAVTMFGLSEKDGMPEHWHTLEDRPEYIRQEMLEKAREIFINAVRTVDKR